MAFYRQLGVDIPPTADTELHVEVIPSLGYFGPDDVCLNERARELEVVKQAILTRDPAEYVYDEGEQGQPAYVFAGRAGSSMSLLQPAPGVDKRIPTGRRLPAKDRN